MTALSQAAEGEQTPWHALDTVAVLSRLNATVEGLAEPERVARRARYGANAVRTRKPKRWPAELAESLTEPLQLLLIAVAALSAVFGELSDALVIAAVIATVAVLETATEMRAAKAIDALRQMSAPAARLITPQGRVQVPAAELVPGDVIIIEAGDIVPADARVLSAAGLKTDESTLTGEAQPAGKSGEPVAGTTDLAERSSMIYAGSPVVAGEATAVVVAIGADSELGRIGRLVTDAKEPPTGLQKALSQLARAVLVLAVAASVLVPLVGVLAGQPWRDMLLSGLTVAFATVPEELPILVVVLLAVGGRQLARRGALLRRLKAGETLGAVTAVVTDKTGTLTENRLTLAGIDGDRSQVLAVAVATQPPAGHGREPLEEQLATAAVEAGVTPPVDEVAAFPFDPVRKLVARAHQHADGTGAVVVSVAGAPEQLLPRCDLPPEQRTAVETRVGELSRQGMRVIAFARQETTGVPADQDSAASGLTYVGVAWFADPLRDGVPQAAADLTAAGVKTIVVTGDHPATAAAIAAQAGLPPGHLIGSGETLDQLSDTDLDAHLVHGTVIARATPAAKHRIVDVLQRRGEVVAVTGDGANDAPALAAADVGIAMGARGADLARAAADLVLTDDAYPTVVAAIGKGRNISAQLRRAVAFYLGAKLALVIVLLAALAGGWPIPFAPVHIVLLEIFMDLGASVAFVAEPAAPDAMRRPPRPAGARFLDRSVLSAILAVAATLTAATLPCYLLLTHVGTEAARSGAVLGWLAGHALIAWTLRTQPWLSWRANPAFPAWAVAALTAGLLLTLTAAGRPVHLTPLASAQVATVAVVIVLAVAAATAIERLLRLSRRL
ncbi:HAD-IC family P-type ATPase [Micromonospora yasonensis]|uniref:cation-translocating P-type ATPase n=1 Tax=Micromonospora yasonensis TaxID=1128667 RepID=UPI00223269E7|nr:HAD-IC family P-type ATPase [Micromonospora yasonensis]MCW3839857.1 HAD-IC family P-type ATPase [Micromonospora yasonensis]